MKLLISLLVITTLLISARQQHPTNMTNFSEIKKGMTKVSVLYPAGEGKTFDWQYYLTKHTPLLKTSLGTALKALTIDKGISGRTPDSPAPYVAMFNMYFESVQAYQTAMAPNGDKIRADVANYTNIQPVIQISEVQE